MVQRLTLAAIVGLSAIFVMANPAAAVTTKTISATVPPELSCSDSGKWRFALNGVGGSTGIAVPPFITATTAAGPTVDVPLIPDASQPPFAIYELAGPAKLTGATAEVDPAWNLSSAGFLLVGGACPPTHAQLTLNRNSGPVGTSVELTTHLSTDHGPLANQPFQIRHHSLDLTGKGETLGPFTTGPDGSFTTHLAVSTLGYHDFEVEYNGSLVNDQALQGASSETRGFFVLPASAPRAAAGRLTSSAGTSARSTTLSGAGFDAQTPVAIVAYSDPLILATVTTDDNGAFTVPVKVPDALVGAHTLVAVGSLGGEDTIAVRYLTLDINLPGAARPGPPRPGAAPPGLPVTGSRLTPIVATGIAALLLGFGLVVLARRRPARARAAAATKRP
jgi:hypothetical protein